MDFSIKKVSSGPPPSPTLGRDFTQNNFVTIIQQGLNQLLVCGKECISRQIRPYVNEYNDRVQTAAAAKGLRRPNAPLDVLLANEIEQHTISLTNTMTKICIPLSCPDYDIPRGIKMKRDALLKNAAADSISMSSFVTTLEASTTALFNNTQSEDDNEYCGLMYPHEKLSQLRNIIKLFPNSVRKLPYLFRCNNYLSMPYIPWIAKIREEQLPLADRLDENDEDTRGGLLAPIRQSWSSDTDTDETKNTLQGISGKYSKDDVFSDHARIDTRVMITLRHLLEINMINANDVAEFDLIQESFHKATGFFSVKRFEFFVRLNPDILPASFLSMVVQECQQLHWFDYNLNNDEQRRSPEDLYPAIAFEELLRITIRYLPLQWKMLFFLDHSVQESPYEVSIRRNGLEATTNRINKVISSESSVQTVINLIEFTSRTKTRKLSVLNFIFGLLLSQPHLLQKNQSNSLPRSAIRLLPSRHRKKRRRLANHATSHSDSDVVFIV